MAELVLAHAAATWFMAGVIWIVLVVHYPLFAGVGELGYARYQTEHMRRITWVVGPAMVVEALTGLWLWWELRTALLTALTVAGVLVWLSTALLQVPQHRRLTVRFDRDAHARLVRSNWVRTLLWSLRGVGVAYVVWRWLPTFATA